MPWKSNGKSEFCTESYSLKENVGTPMMSSMSVCLKTDGSVQIVYFNEKITERVVIGIDDDEKYTILEKDSMPLSTQIYHMIGNEELTRVSLEVIKNNFNKSDSNMMPKNIYNLRSHLLEIGSGEILKAIYDFATNKILLMEKNKELVNEFADQFKSYSGLIK